jgi:hypothetical protein
VADRSIAASLRREIESGIADLKVAQPREGALVIRPGDLRGAETTGFAVPRLRGVLVHQLFRLAVVGHVARDHFADACAAWRAEREDTSALDTLDPDERARLSTEVTAHGVTLASRLDVVNPAWRPRTSVAVVQRLGAGAVVCRDRLDLVVGSAGSSAAAVAILDVTTSPIDNDHLRVLRYHALMETFRSLAAPLRVAALSTATGDLVALDVDRELLRVGLDELQESIARRWGQR